MDTSSIKNFRDNPNFILWMTTVNHCTEEKIRSLTTENYLGGWCEDWALYFAIRYNVPMLFLDERHDLVKIDDKYYDAANPEGVSRLSDLEFVKNPANRLSDKTEEELQSMLKIDNDWKNYPALSHYVHLIEKKGEAKTEPDMNNLKMAKRLVRLARALVATTDDDDKYERMHDRHMQDGKDFPGLAGFFLQCFTHNIHQEQQDAFVVLLRKPGQTINESDYEMFTKMGPDGFDKSLPWIQYLGLIDFRTLNEFKNFIGHAIYRQPYAKNISTNPEALSLLAFDDNKDVSDLAISNKNLPAETLSRIVDAGTVRMKRTAINTKRLTDEQLYELASDTDDVVRNVLAEYSGTLPVNVLEKLANDTDVFVRMSIAERSDITSSIIADNFKIYENSAIDYLLAKNPNTPPEMLDQLADYNENDMRGNEIKARVAENPSTSPETLSKLSKNEIKEIRILVSRNKNTPPETLDSLADNIFNDQHSLIGILNNPNISESTFSKLIDNCDDKYCLTVIAFHLTASSDLFRKLLKKFNVAKNIYGHTAKYDLYKSIVRNPNTPSEILDLLAGVDSIEILIAVMNHGNTSDDTIRKIINGLSPETRINFVKDVQLSDHALAMFKDDPDKRVRRALASDSRIPADVLEYLANDQDADVREAVYRNPNYNRIKHG